MSVFRRDPMPYVESLDEHRRSEEDRRVIKWTVIAMATVGAALLALALFVSRADAEIFCGFEKVRTPISANIATGAAYQQLNVSTTALSLTVPTVTSGGPVVGAYVQVLNGLVNVRVDGTAATATTESGGATWGPGGTTVAANAPYFMVCGNDELHRFSIIRASASGTASTVNIRYYIP